MDWLRRDGPAWAGFVLRVVLGTCFVYHGGQKVFGWWGGPGLAGFAGFVSHQVGLPVWLGYLAALFEFGGGVLCLLGLAAEVGALLLLPVMVVAVHTTMAHGYDSQQHGCEYALNLLLVALAVILGGAGKLALWDPLRHWRAGETAGD